MSMYEAYSKAGLIFGKSSGGGGGTSDYNHLNNLPKINGVEVKGNLTSADIGVDTVLTVSASFVDGDVFITDSRYIDPDTGEVKLSELHEDVKSRFNSGLTSYIAVNADGVIEFFPCVAVADEDETCIFLQTLDGNVVTAALNDGYFGVTEMLEIQPKEIADEEDHFTDKTVEGALGELAEKTAPIDVDGDGTKYLADDGLYHEIDEGTFDYTQLNNLPKINGVEVKGNLTLEDIGIDTPLIVPVRYEDSELIVTDSKYIDPDTGEADLGKLHEDIKSNFYSGLISYIAVFTGNDLEFFPCVAVADADEKCIFTLTLNGKVITIALNDDYIRVTDVKLLYGNVLVNDKGLVTGGQVYEALQEFYEDKSSEITWVKGTYVARKNTNILSNGSIYSYAELNCKKGDVLTIEAPNNSHPQPSTIVPIAKKIFNGTNYVYKALTPTAIFRLLTYVVTEDCTITLSIRHGDYFKASHWYRSKFYEMDVDIIKDRHIEFPYDEVRHKISAISSAPKHGTETKQRPLVLVHSSDFHMNARNVDSLNSFMNRYGSMIDDSLITGDLTSDSYKDYTGLYGEDNRNLLVIGNHDVYNDTTDGSPWLSNIEKYNKYFAPSIGHWDVSRPANAAENGYCYYYKDYTVGTEEDKEEDTDTVIKVRLIVLDAMAYDSTQHQWLSETLNSALNPEAKEHITVVIADHFAPTESATDIDYFHTPFNSFASGMESNYGINYLGYTDAETTYKATDLVDTYINDGGEFACWLCGHYHYNVCGTLKSHPKQAFFAVESGHTDHVYASVPRDNCDESFDLFNLVAIDTFNKTVKIARLGAKYDYYMRKADTLCYNYSTHKLVDEISELFDIAPNKIELELNFDTMHVLLPENPRYGHVFSTTKELFDYVKTAIQQDKDVTCMVKYNVPDEGVYAYNKSSIARTVYTTDDVLVSVTFSMVIDANECQIEITEYGRNIDIIPLGGQ